MFVDTGVFHEFIEGRLERKAAERIAERILEEEQHRLRVATKEAEEHTRKEKKITQKERKNEVE